MDTENLATTDSNKKNRSPARAVRIQRSEQKSIWELIF